MTAEKAFAATGGCTPHPRREEKRGTKGTQKANGGEIRGKTWRNTKSGTRERGGKVRVKGRIGDAVGDGENGAENGE